MRLKELVKENPLFTLYAFNLILGFPLLFLLKGDELIRIATLYLIAVIFFTKISEVKEA